MSAGIRAGSSNDGYVQVNGNDIITALSGGNVGIGNTSPSTKLHVNGTVTATNFVGNIGGTPEFSGDLTIPQWIIHTGDTNTKLGFLSNDVFEIHTAGTERIRVEADGHTQIGGVGLSGGNDHGLTITEPGGTANVLELATSNAIGKINFSRNLSSTLNTTSYIRWGEPGAQGTGDLRFGTSPASNAPVDRLFISSAGKVSVKSAAENTVCISLLDNNSSNEIWRVGQASDGDGYVEILEDGGTVGCKLDASGNSFTMGNFGVGVASPSTTLEVKGDITVYNANNQGDIFFGENGDVADSKALIRMDQLSSTAGELQFHTEGSGTLTKRVTISSTGKLTVTSDSEPQVDVQATNAAGGSMRVQSAGAYAYYMAVSTNIHWRFGMPTGSSDWVLRDNTNTRNRFWVDTGNGAYFQGANHTNLEIRSGDASTKAFVQTVQGSDIRIGSSTDHPVNLYTNSLGRLHLHQDGWCLLHTTTLGNNKNGKELVVQYNNDGVSGGDQGRAGITIRSGQNTSSVSQPGYLFFSDGTSGSNESIGGITYDHADDDMFFVTGGYERLRITDWGIVLGRTNNYWDSTAVFQRDHNARTHILVKNDTNGANAESAITLNASGNSYKLSCGAAGNNSNAFTIARDASGNSGAGYEKFRLDTNDFFYFNTTDNGTTNGNVGARYNWGSANNLNFGMHCTTRQRYSIWEHRQEGRTQQRTAQMSCGENGSNQGTVIMYSSTANADVTGGVNLTNGATSWSGNSDMRLKNKTGDILNALEDINKIEPIRFTWKYGPDNNPHVGVSAQSVENVVPEAIDRAVDVERKREGDETEYMQVRYTELIPISIAAIKELKSEVESLKAEIALLKSS